MQDEYYMARALKLAQRGRFTTHPNPNVGCVIVKDGLAISLAAAEASIGLALLLQLHRRRQNLNIDSVSEMRG